MRRIEFCLLGQIEARQGDRRVELGHARQRCVLVALLVEAGTVVPTDRLVDRVWGEHPPAGARGTLYGYLSRLRGALGEVGPRHDRGGYLIDVDPASVDTHRFTDLLAGARAAGDDQRAADPLTEALGLWRGEAFSGLDTPWINAERDALDAERFTAELDLADIRLRRGEHTELLARLTALADGHPLDERLAGQLILALYRSGRQADALTRYELLRRLLADELGADPGPELADLHRKLLAADPVLLRPARPEPVPVPVPRQLPAPIPVFTGRGRELTELGTADPVPVSAIDGMAGIGKTALAVHAAHLLAPDYPDGQLFFDLHGFTSGVPPVEPAEALDRVLRSLGVPGDRIPAHPDDRAALYRSTLAGRRMLIVLDNAATGTQVRPLLPGTPNCRVLVTSRRRLAGLDHAHAVSLGTLPTADAIALLTHAAGGQRLAGAPPGVVTEIVDLCGRLPLALRVAAARLRSRQAWTPEYLAGRLRDHQDRLAELDADGYGVNAALDLSYHQLAPEARRLYRLLGAHPGHDVDEYAAAALAGTSASQARRLLEALLEVNLVDELFPGRYRFHDLTRAHAAAVLERESEPDRENALTRLFDHYAVTAESATHVAFDSSDDRGPARFAGGPEAGAWLDRELPNLMATATYASDHDRPEYTLRMSAILERHLRYRGHYANGSILHTRALRAAERTGEPGAALPALIGLAHIDDLRGDVDSAEERYRRILAVARSIGDREIELAALNGLARAHRDRGRFDLAVDRGRDALDLATAIGDRVGELNSLTGLGFLRHARNEYDAAASCFELALKVARELGSRVGELNALRGLGHSYRLRGDLAMSERRFEQ